MLVLLWTVGATSVVDRATPRALSALEPTLDGGSDSSSALRASLTTLPGARNKAQCNLCEDHRWLFILATGRSGSTSLLEAMNSLPRVRLSGENQVCAR